jgi:hypothetical protein
MNRKTERIHQYISLIMLVAMIGCVLLAPTAVYAQHLNIAERPLVRHSEQLFTAANTADLAEIPNPPTGVIPPAAVVNGLDGRVVPAEGADVGAAILKNLPNLVGGH